MDFMSITVAGPQAKAAQALEGGEGAGEVEGLSPQGESFFCKAMLHLLRG